MAVCERSGENTLASLLSLLPPEAGSATRSEPGGNTSRPWEPQHDRQAAQSPEDTLPAGALVCFLLDRVPQLDVGRG